MGSIVQAVNSSHIRARLAGRTGLYDQPCKRPGAISYTSSEFYICVGHLQVCSKSHTCCLSRSLMPTQILLPAKYTYQFGKGKKVSRIEQTRSSSIVTLH